MHFLDRRISALATAALVLAAFVHGVMVTRQLDWPAGPDMFRDLGAAEIVTQTIQRTVRHAVPLGDPNYRGEAFWYNPLTPGLVASIAALSRAPIHVVETRAGAYLNVATPLGFSWLAVTLLGPAAALPAVASFLFLQPFSSWESATYSPWLLVSNFAQAFFYVTLVAWIQHLRRPRIATAAVTGLLLGVTLLAHTAPAALLGVILTVTTVWMAIRGGGARGDLLRIAAFSSVTISVALVVALPIWLTVFHYGGRIRNSLPFMWLDPSMEPAALPSFLLLNARRYVLNVGVACGLMVLLRRRVWPARVVVFAWYLGAIALFAWSAYAWRIVDSEALTRLAIAPAHHFLVYFRGAESLLFGLGLASAVAWASNGEVPGRVAVTTVALVAVLVAVHVPSYLERDDFSAYPRGAAVTFTDRNLKATVDFIANQTDALDVFLSPEDAALSLVGATGRKSVIVERFFSNPYVDWDLRDRARNDMWRTLAAAECPAFNATADKFRVSYVFSVEGENPPLTAGVCNLKSAFAAGPFSIFRR